MDLSRVRPRDEDDIGLEYHIIKDSVQCIVQGQHRQVTLKRADTIILERDLSELNLLQVKYWDRNSWVKVIIPRDSAVPKYNQEDRSTLLRKQESQRT